MSQKTQTKTEADDNCPPEMHFDADADKCVKSGGDKSSERHSKEDSNAGTTTDAGTNTLKDADPVEIPATDHKCPPNTTWNTDKGSCEPTGDDAGNPGGAGVGAPEVPGKEFIDILNKSNAAFTEYNQKVQEKNFKLQEKLIEGFMASIGKTAHTEKLAAFGGYNKESVQRSSKVDTSGYDSVYAETVEKPALFLEKLGKSGGSLGAGETGFCSWSINPEAYFDTLPKGYVSNPTGDNAGTVRPITAHKVGQEGFTIQVGDMPQVFSKLVYLIPGGKMKSPIRQYLDTQIIETADRFNWYKVNGVVFTDTQAEGSPITNPTQTITKIQALPSVVRSGQTVKYADIENAPFDLIEAYNRAVALASMDAESNEILNVTYNALGEVATNADDKFSWINGNTGALLTTSDDVAGMTLTQKAVYVATREIQRKGGDTSPGSLVLFLHPKALEELILDTTTLFFTQGGSPAGVPLHSTNVGVLENRLGMDIVPNNRVTAKNNSTNDTFRNILAVKGVIGLAVAADLMIEAQRRPDLSAVEIGARHRIKGAIIDESMTVRISTQQ